MFKNKVLFLVLVIWSAPIVAMEQNSASDNVTIFLYDDENKVADGVANEKNKIDTAQFPRHLLQRSKLLSAFMQKSASLNTMRLHVNYLRAYPKTPARLKL